MKSVSSLKSDLQLRSNDAWHRAIVFDAHARNLTYAIQEDVAHMRMLKRIDEQMKTRRWQSANASFPQMHLSLGLGNKRKQEETQPSQAPP